MKTIFNIDFDDQFFLQYDYIMFFSHFSYFANNFPHGQPGAFKKKMDKILTGRATRSSYLAQIFNSSTGIWISWRRSRMN